MSVPDALNSNRRVNVLGVGISAINLSIARQLFTEAVRQNRKGYVCVTGVHGVMESQKDSELRRIHNEAFLCTPDGMPMVWVGKLRGHKEMSRVYGPDLMLDVFDISQQQGLKHFFYGGANGVAEKLKTKFHKRFPSATIVGTYEPPFRPLTAAEEIELQTRVRETKPDVFWVGLSTPKQEKFMAEFLPKLDVTLMVGVGAAFDFHAGTVKQAPRWVQRSGFEWLYRLCREPRRLWKRYLTNNPKFLWNIFLQLTGLREYPLE